MNLQRCLLGFLLPLLAACVSSSEHRRQLADATRTAQTEARAAAQARGESEQLRSRLQEVTEQLEDATERLSTPSAPCPELAFPGPDEDAELKYRGPPTAPPEASPRGRQVNLVRLFYATDRARTGSDLPMDFYGSSRAAGLQFGTCIVSLPYTHKEGVLETEGWTHFEAVPDINKHVVLLKVQPPVAKSSFFADLRARVEASPSKTALVFIHGYNVTFSTAARRTAQIVYDIGFRGAPIVYSWPSHGTLKDYPGDEGNAAWTAHHLRPFLEELSSRTGATSIHIIAHSMGNRPLVEALDRLSASNRRMFDAVVLTAPDVDAGIMAMVAGEIRKTANSITLYASSKDKALQASRVVHTDQSRAGEAGEHLLVLDGVDTVDASEVETGFFALGHSYTGDNTLALHDLRELIIDRKPPPSRRNLRRLVWSSRAYWRLLQRPAAAPK